MIEGELARSSIETSKCVNCVFPYYHPYGQNIFDEFSSFMGEWKAPMMIYQVSGLQLNFSAALCATSQQMTFGNTPAASDP